MLGKCLQKEVADYPLGTRQPAGGTGDRLQDEKDLYQYRRCSRNEWITPLPHRKITTICAGDRSVRRYPWVEHLPLVKRTRKVLLGKSEVDRHWEFRDAKRMMATRRKMCCPYKELEKNPSHDKLHTANHSALF